MLNIFKLLIKLGDLAVVQLKFSFPYAIHFIVIVKHCIFFYMLLLS